MNANNQILAYSFQTKYYRISFSFRLVDYVIYHATSASFSDALHCLMWDSIKAFVQSFQPFITPLNRSVSASNS